MADTDIKFLLKDFEIIKYESKLLETLKAKYESGDESIKSELETMADYVFSNLQPGDIVRLARHPERPTALDYMHNCFTDFVEMKGLGELSEDAAVIGGIAYMDKHRVMVIGHEKGKFENFRSGGVARAKGYRKALGLIKKAEQMNIPIVSLIDTPGAFPDDEGLQANAISDNIFEMIKLKVPTVGVIIGEGGSGGAMGIGATDKLYMLENSYLSVISVEGACGILRREENDKAVFDKTMEDLKVTANANLNNRTIDAIIQESGRGAQSNPMPVYKNFKAVVTEALDTLKTNFNAELAPRARLNRFRNTARFRELNPQEYSDLINQLEEERKGLKDVKRRKKVSDYFEPIRKSFEFIACPNKEEMGCHDYPKKYIYGKYKGVCKTCGYHFPIPVEDALDFYLELLVDSDRRGNLQFVEFNNHIISTNPIGFEGFDERLHSDMITQGQLSGLVTGLAKMKGKEVVLAISNYGFRRGTLGGAESEKFVQAVNKCISSGLPLVGVHQSGGVRIQEGVPGLMQMATTNAALVLLEQNNIPYVSVLLNATMGGVLASYASRGDFTIGEMNAQIGFAGLDVIAKTTQQKLDKDYQASERVMQRGGLDILCPRTEIKNRVAQILEFYDV